MDAILREARELADSGARELIVVAQDSTYYGRDIYGESRLTELLIELQKVDGIDWIRLMYFYPMYIDDVLIQTIADCDKILPYIDMPLQHINDTMLRRMSRKVNRKATEEIIQRLRAGIPDLALRTTLITGFPGETEDQFQELAEFVEQQQFERLGVFTYSYEDDTPSARLPDHVDQAVMDDRRQRLMQIQQGISQRRNASLVGNTIRCIIDQPVPDQPSHQPRAWVARSRFDAPDVDALVFVTENDAGLTPGDLVDCEVVQAQDYDLIAVAVSEPS